MRLSVKALALTGGIFCGGGVLVATLWLLAFGYDGTLIKQLDHFYFGYSFTVPGAFIGMVWGFLDGALCGALFAWVYNKFAGE